MLIIELQNATVPVIYNLNNNSLSHLNHDWQVGLPVAS